MKKLVALVILTVSVLGFAAVASAAQQPIWIERAPRALSQQPIWVE